VNGQASNAWGGRALKLLACAWVLAAIAVETVLMAPGWRALPAWTLGTFAAGLVAALATRRAVSAVLVLVYVFPVVLYRLSGQAQVQFDVVWMAALVGAILPDAARTDWRFPRPWRTPLVYWILAIIVSASIVAAREIDFTWALVHVQTISNSSIGGWPTFMIAWTAHVALVLLVGLLWFDWLNGRAPGEFLRLVIVPLLVSLAAASAISVYQALGHLAFLNPTVYQRIGRTTGGALDANVSGMIAAMWIGGVMAFAWRLRGWKREALAGAGCALLWAVAWTTGSRTTLAAGILISAGCAIAVWRAWRGRGGAVAWKHVAGAVALGVAAVLLVASQTAVRGPIRRIYNDGLLRSGSPRRIVAELWNRDEYGTVATQMIGDYPLFGIGVGSFHVMLPDYGRFLRRPLTKPDNAQNWFRHQLAEFGVVGSLGWIVWVVGFAGFIVSRRHSAPPAAWTLCAVLVAFAAVSMVGMPGQDLAVGLTFWTMAFWFSAMVGPPQGEGFLGRRSTAIAAIALVVFAAGTVHLAEGALRVPARAQRTGWQYRYGFYSTEFDAAGNAFRWTGRHAVAVVDATTQHIELTVSVNHPDLASHPVHARVWCDGAEVIDTTLSDSHVVTRRVDIPKGVRAVMIETRVDRTERPSDHGASDARDLGLMVAWRFQDR
jgi:O-Antigen ligase